MSASETTSIPQFEPRSLERKIGKELRDTEPGKVFQRLAELIYADSDPGAIHLALANAAVDLIDGCDHASIMVAANGRFRTVAATDQVAAHVDMLEREVGSGPCVDAIVEDNFQVDPNIEDKCQWPDLAKRLLDETPVRGMIGYRILADNRKVGALNVFSDTADALTEQSADQGAVVASFASVSFMMLSAKEQAETMSRGLDSNREIGKAIGLLMAAHRFTEDEAFELLRTTSQNLNMKISAVARKVVEGQQSQYARGERDAKPSSAL
ncbi:GAF and ANTAR domain-containing protein [Blastococcus sp. Marseille-P5729]|uniref:GAF and ANTAR domain-containing protein n=1 Tax=Blastococcus sp. Marseille-P5729 TaxID=2086582 RepID=UPI0018FEB32E|nr:GAF and ANTAR domain-containing protein [Blastococcus sp. Marseille-P5729]